MKLQGNCTGIFLLELFRPLCCCSTGRCLGFKAWYYPWCLHCCAVWGTCLGMFYRSLTIHVVNQGGNTVATLNRLYGFGSQVASPSALSAPLPAPMNTQQRLPDVLGSARVGVYVLGKKKVE